MRKPKLVHNWRRVARCSWSFWLSILASVLGAIEFALPFVAPVKPDGCFAAAACAVALLAAAARLILQRSLHEN